MHSFKVPLIIAVLLSAAVCLPAAQVDPMADGQGPYRILASYPLGGTGGWDLLTLDADARRLYIARSTRVMVVDADSGKLIGEIPGNGVHGIAVVPDANRGYITNGKDNTVSIFDLKTLAVIGHAPTGTKPDAIIYDLASKLIFVCDNGGTTITVLAPEDGHVVKTIEVGGAPELVAVDGKGRLYTNLEDKDEVGVVDTLALKLLAHWPLAPGAGPSGIAVDTEHHRVFSICHDSKTMETMDTESGKVVATSAIGAGADGAVFDPASQDVCIPNGDGTMTVIHETGPDLLTVVQTVVTKVGARTITMDEKTHHLYMVTADKKPDAVGEAPTRGRPQFLPDTFVILVVGR